MQARLRAVLTGVAGLALAAASASTDHLQLTRELMGDDPVRRGRLFCPDAVAIRPDGLVSPASRSGAPSTALKRPPVSRSWTDLSERSVGNVTIVTGALTTAGRYGKAEELVTAVWRDAPSGACAVLLQRAPGGRGAEAAQWDTAYLTSETISREPSALLVDAVRGVRPGTALDVGMGQGRNSVYLAKQGWAVTGFDIAGEGLRLARANARAAGVTIETVYASDDEFDFGQNRWDLIAFMYVNTRPFIAKAFSALRPGGLVVAEAFSSENDPARAGDAVDWSPGEMKRLFERAGFETIRYQEPVGTAEFSLRRLKLVRLIARKPDR